MKICFKRKLTKLLSCLKLLQNLSPSSSGRIMKMAALKGRILVFENTQLAYTKTTSWSRTRKYLFIWRGTFNCFLLIIHILLCFSLNSYCSCHWWFYLLMWLRVKEEIWIDWIYCTGTLIPVKFHSKVIAIGYWLANFSWFQIYPWKLKDFLLFGCNA